MTMIISIIVGSNLDRNIIGSMINNNVDDVIL